MDIKECMPCFLGIHTLLYKTGLVCWARNHTAHAENSSIVDEAVELAF